MRIWLVLLAALWLPGCRKTVPSAATPPGPTRSWLDLTAGWRLRTIGPVMAGNPQAPLFTSDPATLTGQSLNITLKASPDLLGFETFYYLLENTRQGELSLRLTSAVQTIDGKEQPHPAPQPALRIPPGTRFARLLYLLRASSTDHNMALLTAANPEALARLTTLIQADPTQCQTACQWVPPRVALRAEKPLRKTWVPVEP